MARLKYRALSKTWISHEGRFVEPGQEFETEFPKTATGEPMRLGSNLELVEPEPTPAPTSSKGQKAEKTDSLV